MTSGFVVAPLVAALDTRPPWARGGADAVEPAAPSRVPSGGGEAGRGDLGSRGEPRLGDPRSLSGPSESGRGDHGRCDERSRPRSWSARSESQRDEDGVLSDPLDPRDEPPSTAAAPFVPDVLGGALRRRAVPRHPSLGALGEYLADPEVTDVFVNGVDGLFVDRGGGAERIADWHADEPEVRALAVALIGLGGRHIDDATPCVDVRLDGGIRVHAVLPPVAPDGAAVSIRLPSVLEPSLDELARRGLCDDEVRARLEALVAERRNVLITGATGSGKTTLLAALLAAVPPGERIVTIEDVAELRIAHPHHVRLEARQANLEGAGAVDLARLVREALRMRPDRLVVGECRGAEVRELLTALNTGHRGGAGTLHASSLRDVPARLEALGALAGLDDRALARQVVSAIEVVLHLDRDPDGRRRIAAVGRPELDEGRLVIRDLGWPT